MAIADAAPAGANPRSPSKEPAVAKPEWGKKRVCPSCATKFYDLRKSPIVCPSCGEQIDPDSGGKSKRSRGSGKDTGGKAAAAAGTAAAAPAAEAEEELESVEADSGEYGEESEDTSEDYGVDEDLEDADDLGEDQFSEVVSGEEDGNEDS
jgi:uncharacterized protein (TIGR02300 family)